MYDGQTVGVVIPAYNEAGFVGDVIETLPSIVDRAYVVDDCSTDDTWTEVAEAAARMNGGETATDAQQPALRTPPGGSVTNRKRGHARSVAADGRDVRDGGWQALTGESPLHADGGQLVGPQVVAMRHDHNRGVGGAIKTGYELAEADGLDVVAVMNGDGQMDPKLLARIVAPVVEGRADYAKGNRLDSADHRAGMPPWRLFGNGLLTYLTKFVSGYWGMSDPQNGYTAISRRALERIDVERLYEGYGFCNDVLVHLNVHGFRIEDVPMPARYGEEESHIRYSRFVPTLSWLLLRRGLWRYRTQYGGSGLRQPYSLLLAGVFGGAVGLIALGLTILTVGVGSTESVLALTTALLGGLFVVLAATMDRFHSRTVERERYGSLSGE